MIKDIQQMHIDTILLDVHADNVKQVFQKLSKHVSNLVGAPEKFLFNSLMQRETHQNSGIGHGVAIADTKLPRLTHPMIVFARLTESIEYDAADGEPVDMIALVLSPEFEGPKHLQRLATTTRFFGNQKICADLRLAENYEAVRNIVKTANILKQEVA